MKILFWLNNARYNALPQSLLPAVVALCLACKSPSFSWLYAVLAIVGVVCAHLGCNLLDDYFDYKNKGVEIRNNMAAAGMRARIAKCEYLTSGKATMRQLLSVAAVFCLIAVALGVVIFLKRGMPVVYIALIAGVLGYSYSGSPLKLAYRGLGEIIVAIEFGVLNMIGVYYSACGCFSNEIWTFSIALGLLVANVLFTHSIMDFEPDKQVGKVTLAVLLNNKKAMLAFSFCFILFPFLVVAAAVIFAGLSLWYLLVFLALPLACYLFYLMCQFVKGKITAVKPKFWMLPMEKWEQIKLTGIDWFMIRWFLARNLLMAFSFVLIVVSLLLD